MEVIFWTLKLYFHVILDTSCLDLHGQLVSSLDNLKAGMHTLGIAKKGNEMQTLDICISKYNIWLVVTLCSIPQKD